VDPERRAHVLQRLQSDDKLWIATASRDGSAHLDAHTPGAAGDAARR
jgi:hypothetical protein